METHDFSNAKVGDNVTCLLYGKGHIKDIIEDYIYPIIVEFESGFSQSYFINGNFYADAGPSLYHGHVDFKIEVIEPCPYEVGEMIAVEAGVRGWLIKEFGYMDGGIVFDSSNNSWAYHRKLSSFNQKP